MVIVLMVFINEYIIFIIVVLLGYFTANSRMLISTINYLETTSTSNSWEDSQIKAKYLTYALNKI